MMDSSSTYATGFLLRLQHPKGKFYARFFLLESPYFRVRHWSMNGWRRDVYFVLQLLLRDPYRSYLIVFYRFSSREMTRHHLLVSNCECRYIVLRGADLFYAQASIRARKKQFL